MPAFTLFSPRPRPWGALLALLFLNLLLSWTNIWPTPWVRPDHRFSGELALLVSSLLFLHLAGVRLGQRAAAWLASVYGVLVLGRYIDLMAPSLFGRPINLYWDVPQLPRFVWVTVQAWPWWLSLLALVLLSALAAVFWGVLRAMWRVVLLQGLPAWTSRPWGRRCAIALAVLASGLSLANLAGMSFTWPYVSKPVVPVYAKQLGLVAKAVHAQWNPAAATAALPASPAIDAALALPDDQRLAGLRGKDVWLVSLESFGAVMQDDPELRAALANDWQAFQSALASAGFGIRSGFFESPTIGGGSDLSHVGLLSGIDLSVPQRHDLLITTSRPTMLQVFQKSGYEAVGVYASVYWPWPEREFYRYNRYLDGPALNYQGPPITYWRIPDQAAWALAEPLLRPTAETPPQLVFFPLITTHFPFSPTPPLQSEWSRLLSANPYDADDLARVYNKETDWLNMRPGYISLAQYTLRWLAQAVQRPWPRDRVLVFFGDHQPTANVSGANPPWDVPVVVAAADARILERLSAEGLTPGLFQDRTRLGGFHDLTGILLRSFAGQTANNTPAPKAEAR